MEFVSVRGLIFVCIFVHFVAEECRAVLVVSKRCGLHVLCRKKLGVFGSSVSVACEHKYWLVLPTSSEFFSEKWEQRLRAGLDRARKVRIGFQVQRLNHWAIIALLDNNLFLMESDSVLGHFVCLRLSSIFCWGLSCWSFQTAVAYMSFPGKVIENLWFASLSFLRTQVLVRVPKFFLLIFWEKRSNAASRVRTCTGSCHWSSRSTP